MIPNALALGLGAGLLTHRAKPLAITICVCALAWACLVLLPPGDGGVNLFLGAFVLGAANTAVGVLAGVSIRLATIGLLRTFGRLRGDPSSNVT